MAETTPQTTVFTGTPPRVVTTWVLLCSGLGVIGWLLSALHQLNQAGYALALPTLLFVILFVNERITRKRKPISHFLAICRLRARRSLPACYFILAGLALLGGILYAPNNYDALAYRIPRVLNWLAEEQWHWISTVFHRLNTRGSGIEWVSAPIILLSGSDRLLFLPSIISFLLMPGLTYSVLTRLCVSPRVAWHWMWILPSGYCYVLQAGGIGNDLFGTVLALCAIDLALRAHTTGHIGCTLLSLLAAASMTAAKTNNLTLGLAWAVLIAGPLWWSIRNRTGLTLLSGMIAIVCSFVPTAILNHINCKDWSGARAEHLEAFTQGDPFFRITHNFALTIFQNVAPPILPFGGRECSDIIRAVLPEGYQKKAATLFESRSADWRFPEMQMEEGASVGVGILLLLLLGLFYSIKSRTRFQGFTVVDHIPKILALVFVSCVALGFTFFCSRSGFVAVGRYFGLYFPFLLPVLLWLPGFRRVLSKRIWSLACFVVMGTAALLLVVSPSRPLLPAETLIAALRCNSTVAASRIFARMESVYSTYSNRSEAFQPLVRAFSHEKVVGIYTSDDPETSLWKPFGSRRVVHILPTDTKETLRLRGIRVGAIKADSFGDGQSFRQWCSAMGAEPIARVSLNLRARLGSVDWIVVKFN